MAKLYTTSFADPILTLSLFFSLAKSFTRVAFCKEHTGLYSSSNPAAIPSPHSQEKRNHPSSLFPDSPTQIYVPAPTSHLVSNKHSGHFPHLKAK